MIGVGCFTEGKTFMGVEAIGSGISGACLSFGEVGSVASAVGRGVGKMAAFGAKLEAPLSSFVKEGPAPSLAGFKPMGASEISIPDLGGVFRPAAQLNFIQPMKSLTPVGEAGTVVSPPIPAEPAIIRQAEQVAQQAQRWVVMPKIEPIAKVIPEPAIQSATRADNIPATFVASQPHTETRISNQEAQVTVTVPKEQEVEEIIEQDKTVEDPKTSAKEEVLDDERFYLEDEQASAQRKYEIKKALGKAKIEADRLGLKKIAGWLVAKLMPPEHSGNRSQIVREKGPDGSYQETVEAIAAISEFTSEQQAEERSSEIVAEKIPVKRGKHGRRVSNKEIARVFKLHFVKPVASEIAQKRIVKKVVQILGQNQAQITVMEAPGIKSEGSLADYPKLAEVFGS